MCLAARQHSSRFGGWGRGASGRRAGAGDSAPDGGFRHRRAGERYGRRARRRVASISAAGRRQRPIFHLIILIDQTVVPVAWSPIFRARARSQSSLILPQSRVFLSRRPANPFYCGSGAEFDVRYETKQRTSPIGAAPGVSVVQSFVACLRLALGMSRMRSDHICCLSYCRRGCGRWARHSRDTSSIQWCSSATMGKPDGSFRGSSSNRPSVRRGSIAAKTDLDETTVPAKGHAVTNSVS